ncbi:ParB/RepB/Spo0J family partition protein [Singulisphaera sp. GP187]|uniref:ParB/RepB/Spo0J family partition protein n=1 Tax=Singulisphaera sp. GP187 TaxID=1882752 RepID=UPI000928825E|nr:ParB/RepB/Spo0J family partition protein [Singulisphaera sp. GP187]SIO37802.1 ParB/RepB/Spo0J family partition protein [Singulisphaera sp. GP187]
MDAQIIECRLIDVPKAKPEDRTFSKEFAIKLADSIKIDGQLQPIVVRPNPNSPGRYILIAGRHRLYAKKNALKEQFINATIIADMDETEADMASITENLWRNPLSKAQHALAIKKWHDHWVIKMTPAEKTAQPIVAATEKESADPILQSDKSSIDPTTVADETEKVVRSADSADSETKFDETVAAATGQSVSGVQRAKRIANAFTEDQLQVFTQMEVNQTDMLRVAKIKDEAHRGEVVNLIATGMTVDEAIKEVVKDKAPARDNGTSKAEKEAKEAAKVEKEPEMTDGEWLAKYCGEKAAMLKSPAKYYADALLFRVVCDARHAFRCKSKKSIATTKKGSVTGAFWNLVNRFVSVSHPKDWLICPECKGQGDHPSVPPSAAVKCPKCFGGGYLLKTEEYL